MGRPHVLRLRGGRGLPVRRCFRGSNAYVAIGDASVSVDASDGASLEDAPDRESAAGDDAGEAGVLQDDGGAQDGGPGLADDASCTATVPVCDPVHNTGCNPFQQCDVDPSQTITPAGLCLFHSAPADAGPCLQTVVSETCDAQATCVAGACRALCNCNADCPPGQCCADTSGPKGFRLCGSCP